MLVLLLAIGCNPDVAQESALAFRAAGYPEVPLGLDAVMDMPEENLLTAKKVELGRRLFFEPLLSRDRTLACSSCHRPALAFSDTAPVSKGIGGRRGTRNTPTLLNRAYGRSFFWDGRVESLEKAVVLPIGHPDELGLGTTALADRLQGSPTYRALFAAAFGDLPISEALVGRALASYLRTLLSGAAPVDRYLAGDTSALPAGARRGRVLFLGKAGCASCHSGPNFSDERFHNTGVSWGSDDPGRFAVTRDTLDRGRFKTPTLRRIADTAPYMHDGSLPTLEEVIEFYDRGGEANPNLDGEIGPLELLPSEKSDLLAFLRSLGPSVRRR